MKRHEFLRHLHRLLQPRNYLEIGVNDGRSLAISRAPSIAVDPDLAINVPIKCDVHLVKMTSDDFFAKGDPIRHIRSGRNPLRNARRGRPWLDAWRGGTTLDLTFIDGMHWFEYALRDFMNVERYARPTSVIVFDDMLPRNSAEASRAGNPIAWAGDVFKVALALAEYRPDLVLIPVDTQPTGVLVVLGATPGDRTLSDAYEAILARWSADDPQSVPTAILERSDAVDADALVASEIWSWLAGSRHGQDHKVIERIRASLPAIQRASPREPSLAD